MYKNAFWCVILIMLIVGCQEKPEISPPPLKTSNQKSESFKRTMSNGDYNFQLEYNDRLDTSYFDVLLKGKKISRQGYKGKIKDEILADLNRDGNNEIYIHVWHENQSQLFGYFFEDGKAIEIKKEEYRKLAKVKSTSYKVRRNQLMESYNFLNSDGKIVSKESRYNLVKRNEEYVLLPEGWQPNELGKIGGQYVARDATDAGYYKVMLLKKKSGGIWNIDIKTKSNGDKNILCDFNADGYFVDRDLMVPLDQVDPNLKGRLQIRFLDLMAVVFTENISDSKEMISFCNGRGSIAGNFKKTNI